MALAAATLSQALQALSARPPLTIVDAAQRWSAAYASYASTAQALDAIVVIVPAKIAALQAAFASAMTAGKFLDVMPAALSAFWMLPVRVPLAGVANSGVVATTTSGDIALPIGIAKFRGDNKNVTTPAGNKMNDLAQALHGYTTLISATMTNTQTGATSIAFLA